MIKKSVVTCSLMLMICVLTKMFGCSYSTRFNEAITSLPVEKFQSQLVIETETKELLNFANEMLPIGDKSIELKMKKALKANSFSNLQTHKLHTKAEKWFPIIEPILKKYGIPEDFKYMPLVESGLSHHRQVSPKGAAGIWQFMLHTARSYGLIVNDEIDQRYDVHLATVAAAKYLRDLNKIFNNWTLSAAAYNIGEGRLQRHIRSQKEDNYFKLKLNRETGKYVYSLISMKEVIENPAKYGYKIKNSKNLLAYKK